MTEADYHNFIRQHECVRCHAPHAEVAHFSGRYSSSLGKGMGKKAFWHCCAALCRPCHVDFDSYSTKNDDARAAEFLVLILKTQRAYLTREVAA